MAEETKLANPAVLGLTCFGLTTTLLNLHNAGLFKQDRSILAMGLFLGGTVQIIAGILEYKKGNTFGLTAFCAYGAFWLTLVFIIMTEPWLVTPLRLQEGAKGLAWYLALWGLFTCLRFVGTLKVNRVLQFVFLTLIVLFALLAIHFWWFTGVGDTVVVLRIAGVVGIVCGLGAVYLAQAELWNEMYGRVVLPIGPMNVDYKKPEDL